MAFNIPNGAFRLTPEEAGGQPNYTQALRNAFLNSQDATETAYKPKTMAEQLLAAKLQNKINTPKSEDAANWYDLEKQAKQAEINKANRPDAITGETAQLFALRNTLPEGPDRDRVDQIISMKARGSNGTTVFDPASGNPLVQIGGAAGRSGGGTFMNPTTGEITSQPTGATASNLQQRVVGADALKPYVQKILETMPQFQSPVNQASLLGQKLANAFGGQNFALPSQEASGKAAIKEASEGMLKTFGLNATGANRQAMEDIVKPKFGESSDGYARRVKEQAAAYAQNKKLAQEALSGGIKLNNKPSSESKKPVPSGKIRVFFPDGPHVIPKHLLNDAIKSGATLQQEIPNG